MEKDEYTEDLSESDSTEDTSPDDLINVSTDLKDDEDEEVFTFNPPEEAKQINVSNVLLVILLTLVLIIGFIVFIMNFNKTNKNTDKGLDKSGIKFIPSIPIAEQAKDNTNSDNDIVDVDGDDGSVNKEITSTTKKNENLENIIKNLPEEFKQPEPSISPITINNTNKSSSGTNIGRPDTRNSNSIRKIEGLFGQEFSASNKNSEIISSVLNGTYKQNSNTNISKEEYVQNLLNRTTQNPISQSGNNQTSQNKTEYFSNTTNTTGNGKYLSASSLWDGTIITGALITAINTDNPGVIIARTTENIYSSYDSSFLLIPEGTLLYATYNTSITYGDNRVQIAWNLLIRPDGYRMELGNMNGIDFTGQSGTKGWVNNHPFETLKAYGLIAVFSIIQTEITNDLNNQTNEYLKNSLDSVYTEALKLGNKIVERALDIKPTIFIEQGTLIKFITNVPLNLPPVKVNQVNQKYIRLK